MSEILLQVSRGAIAENIIRGNIAVVGSSGQLIGHAGDPRYYTYMRSTAKPLQASAALECGALEHFGITDAELAIMCSSHMGEDYHVAVLEGILSKIGLKEDDLTLGADLSLSETVKSERLIAGIIARKLYNNCSGKHCCMLTMCRYNDWPYEAYQRPDHPVQQLILDTVAEYTHMKRDDITIGVDGCGVPVFAMPLYNMAVGYHDLIVRDKLPEKRKAASARIIRAMGAFPELVSGNGTFTTELMRVTKGRVIAKMGADAVYCAAVPDRGISISIKIEDGNGNMVPPVLMRVLTQLEVVTSEEYEKLRHFAVIDNINCQNDKVGETRAVFDLVRDANE